MISKNSSQSAKITVAPAFSFVINVFTMNRPASFQRLWASISAAKRINNKVTIRIHPDFDPTFTTPEYIEGLTRLSSPHGRVEVRPHYENNGLRYNILESWMTPSQNEFGIFLEDDVEVSPYFLLYLQQSIQRYYYSEKSAPSTSLVGVSLYNMKWDEVHEHAFTAPKDNQTAFLLGLPQSWGAAYHGPKWLEFLDWYTMNADTDPFLPDSLTNRWPAMKSWKKYMIRWMASKAYVMLYPNIPGGFSFSTNHLEVGANNKLARKQDKDRMGVRFTVPLLTTLDNHTSAEDGSFSLPFADFENMTILNTYQNPVKSVDELKIDVSTFDKCHLVLNLVDASKVESLPELMEHYHNFDFLESIYILWNLVDIEIPEAITKFQPSSKSVPIKILKQAHYSRNNKFAPLNEYSKDCIISIDSDWRMPHSVLSFAVKAWQGHFFQHLVGFRPQARTHVPTTVPGKYSYFPLTGPASSLIKTSGVVYHKRYHHYYSHPMMKKAREMVDRENDCEDIVLNAIIARFRFAAPAIINWKNEGPEGPLEDLEKRSKCIDGVSEVLGGHWLRYFMTGFDIVDLKDSKAVTPNLNRHIMAQRGGMPDKGKQIDVPKELWTAIESKYGLDLVKKLRVQP